MNNQVYITRMAWCHFSPNSYEKQEGPFGSLGNPMQDEFSKWKRKIREEEKEKNDVIIIPFHYKFLHQKQKKNHK